MPETVAPESPPATHSLEAVFVAERTRLLAFLRRVGAADDAEDILHDAWIRIRSLDRPVPSEALAYLYRMLHNLLIDRRRSAQRLLHRDTAWAELGSGTDDGRPIEPDVERRAVAVDEVRAAYRIIDDLGEPAAGIFRRHRLEGQTQRSIADELGMGLSTVEKHLRRAYAALLAFREGTGHD